MITRKEFFTQCAAACTAGLCCSLGQSQEPASAQPPCDPEETKQLKDRGDAARERFAHLLTEMDNWVRESERKELLHGLGGWCAYTYQSRLINQYKGNIQGFLEAGLRLWMAEAHYDEATGTIRVSDRFTTCSCPLVKEGTTPPSFCDCTLGWQEAAYSTILGRPVKAELKESILRGDKRCTYEIKVI